MTAHMSRQRRLITSYLCKIGEHGDACLADLRAIGDPIHCHCECHPPCERPACQQGSR